MDPALLEWLSESRTLFDDELWDQILAREANKEEENGEEADPIGDP